MGENERRVERCANKRASTDLEHTQRFWVKEVVVHGTGFICDTVLGPLKRVAGAIADDEIVIDLLGYLIVEARSRGQNATGQTRNAKWGNGGDDGSGGADGCGQPNPPEYRP